MQSEIRVSLPEIVGAGYGKYWRDKSRYRVLKGGKGSKKSATTALNFIYRIMKYPSSNLLVVRRVMNTHRDSTFAQLKWAQERLQVSHLWQNNVSPMEMTFLPTGQKILFRGFDDVLKLASTTVSNGYLCWVWVEEAFEIEHEADFEKLDLSVPRGNIPSPLFKQTTLTFNPWSSEHWLKKRFFDKVFDNVSTYTTNYLCNEFLDSTDRSVFERMKRENARKYAVAGLGEWGVAEGLVYENWEIKDFSVTDPYFDDFSAFFGLDYGYTFDPTAFVGFLASRSKKEIWVFEEFYKRRMLNCDIAAKIIEMGYKKERIRADSAEPKSNDDLRRLGIRGILPSVKGADSILNGIAAISEYKIFIHPKCENFISEISRYSFRQDASENGKNYPEDKNNHLMDAMRYAFYDVRFQKPQNTAERKTRSRHNITAADITGGWGG